MHNIATFAKYIVRSLTRKTAVTTTAAAYPQYEIGKFTYGRPTVWDWNQSSTLKVGNYCSFAPGVKILLGGEHRHDWVTTYPFPNFEESAKHIEGHPSTKGDVIIENDVWIGMNATILSGVRVENGAVISASAVVTRDVSAYSIVGGNPARQIRSRFSPSQIRSLLSISWWNWDPKTIANEVEELCSSNIDDFILKHQ